MIENIDDHRQKFNDRVMELQEKKGKNSRMLTKEHYMKTVERLKKLENPLVPRTLPDHNLLRRFALLRVESGFIRWKSLLSQVQILDLFLLRICSTLFI